MYCAQL